MNTRRSGRETPTPPFNEFVAHGFKRPSPSLSKQWERRAIVPQGRIILKSISESKKLAMLETDSARLLFSWLIPHLDREGRFSGDAEVVNKKIFTRLKKQDEEIETYLKDLERVHLIMRYKAEDDIFLHVPTFKKKQPYLNPQREAESKYPEPTLDLFSSEKDSTHEQVVSNSRLTPDELSVKVKEKVKVKVKVNTPTNSGVTHEQNVIWIELRQKIDALFKKSGHTFPSPTLDYITTISIFDFPEIPHLEELKKKIAWWINHPLTKTSNIALQVRNWYSNAVDFYKDRDRELHIGKNREEHMRNFEAQKKAESIVLPSFAERIKEAEKNPDKSFLTKLLIEREKDIQSKKKQILEAESAI